MVATNTTAGKAEIARIERTPDGRTRVAFRLDGRDHVAEVKPHCLGTLPLFQAAVFAACGVWPTAVEPFDVTVVTAPQRGASR